MKFQHHKLVQQAFASDPAASGKVVARTAKKMIEKELQNKRLVHNRVLLEVQGKLYSPSLTQTVSSMIMAVLDWSL